MHRLQHRLERWSGPPWPRPVRLAIALGLVSIGFICYYFRLTTAHGFGLIGFSIAFVIHLIKRILWKRSLRQAPTEPTYP